MGYWDKFNSAEVCGNTKIGVGTKCAGFQCYKGECFTKEVGIFGNYTEIVYENCTCEQGWIGLACDQCCTLPCVQGECDIDHTDDKLFCSCYSDYTGKYCEEFYPTTIPVQEQGSINDQTLMIVTITVALVLIAFFTTALILYTLHKSRYCLILKLWHTLRKVDTKRTKCYDVFLNYHESDSETTFIAKLLSILDKWSLKLCINHKCSYSLPEEYKNKIAAVSLKDGIEDSHTIIALLSPAYIKGNWVQFEKHWNLTLDGNIDRIMPITCGSKDDNKNQCTQLLRSILASTNFQMWHSNMEIHESKLWSKLKDSLEKRSHHINTVEHV